MIARFRFLPHVLKAGVYATLCVTLVACCVVVSWLWHAYHGKGASLDTFDWNAVSAAFSLVSFVLTIGAVGFAWKQLDNWKDGQRAIAKAIAMSVADEFFHAHVGLMRVSELLSAGHVYKDVAEAAIKYLPETKQLELFLPNLHTFENDGPHLTGLASTIINIKSFYIRQLENFDFTEKDEAANGFKKLSNIAAGLGESAWECYLLLGKNYDVMEREQFQFTKEPLAD